MGYSVLLFDDGGDYRLIPMKKAFAIILLSGTYLLAQAQSLPGQAYLGQAFPGTTPVLFAPGVVSTDSVEHSSPTFSPDGQRVLWTVINRPKPARILESEHVGGHWTIPASPTFASPEADDFYPSFSADGMTLYFSSRRKQPHGRPAVKDMGIWQVTIAHGQWSQPVPFDTVVSKGVEYAHSVSARGTLFYSFYKDRNSLFDIAFSEKEGGHYGPPQTPKNINSDKYDDGPFIAPDESYLIFESGRDGGIGKSIDLYISFRKTDNSWTTPLNMGPRVNTADTERFARVSPDGKFFFFGSNRGGRWFDIYWMDASIIDELRETMLQVK